MTIGKKNPSLIKVIDREVSDYLIASGFSYIKEGDVFVFCSTPEIIAVLKKQFSNEKFIVENKLRF